MKFFQSTFSLLFVLMMFGIEVSGWASEAKAMTYPQPPQPPQPAAVAADKQPLARQTFSGAGGSIDMQIVGKVPTVNAHDNTRLDFAAGSSVHVTFLPQGGTASTVIVWDAAACTSTVSGQSRQCQAAERKQVIALIRQLPATPVPPPPPAY